ncbi:hypothetical protein AGMMS50268_28360 [Spirochaetia bacterium]|nr:hypothetical protein AGMMS50268_28360 [Spirochaetia bacterium]
MGMFFYRSLKGLLGSGIGAAILLFSPPAHAQDRPPPSIPPAQEIILVRGNTWVLGLPGFGSNRFSALFGEYRRAESAEPGSAGAAPDSGAPDAAIPAAEKTTFFLWLSGEGLDFSDGAWQARPGLGAAYSARQRRDGEGLIISLSLNGQSWGAYTALFEFPRGIAAAGLTEAQANGLVQAWAAKFLYFLALVKTAGDMSLPAVVEF